MVSPRTRWGRSASQRPRRRRTASSRASVGRHVGVGDGEPVHTFLSEQLRQPVEPFVHLQRRTGRSEDDQTADGVNHAGTTRQTGCDELIGKVFVSGQKQLERSAVENLARERARRAKHQVHLVTTLARKSIRGLLKGEAEARRCGNRRWTLCGETFRDTRQQPDGGEPVHQSHRISVGYFLRRTTSRRISMRTDRAGRASLGATILNGPWCSANGCPSIVSATMMSLDVNAGSSSASENTT